MSEIGLVFGIVLAAAVWIPIILIKRHYRGNCRFCKKEYARTKEYNERDCCLQCFFNVQRKNV